MLGGPIQVKREKRAEHQMRQRIDGLQDRMLLLAFKVNTTLDTIAVSANSIEGAIQVLSGTVQISGVTIERDRADEDGGLLNSGGKVTLSAVAS
jgi:hypothetical protein